MLQLEIDERDAIILQFNPGMKALKGAGVRQPVTVLRMTVTLDADVLAFFEPTLKDHYFVHGAVDLIEGLVLRDRNEVFPHERNEEMSGAKVRLGTGLGPAMEFPDADLSKFKLSPADGGMVVIVFDVEIKPDETQAGRLYMLQEQKVVLTVEPRELPEMKAAA
jgi:hypothetical protein